MDNTSKIRLSIAPVDEKHLDSLHKASLEILAHTGLNVHSAPVREMLANAGAIVKDDLRVYIPAALVENALASAPSKIEIYNRKASVAMTLEGENSYFGTGSDLEYSIDSNNLQRRESILEDVKQAAQVCEKLSNIDFVMSYALPNDIPAPGCEIEQFKVMLENTVKPIIMTEYSGKGTLEHIHKMACQSCGGEANFRQAPNYILYGQFISPLQHDAGALDRLMFCAGNAIPIVYVPTIMMGVTGPVTLAGAIALANAECLAGLVMHQLKAPGAPFIYGGCISPLDMKTTVYSYGAPEWRLADVVLSQLSLRYKLPVFGTAGATDSKVIDAQAGAEWAYSLLACALAGTNLIHDVGYMESGLSGSLEALVICNDIIGMVKRIISGFEINEETLALDIINRVDPAGHFTGEEHTLNNFKKAVWYPSIMERNNFEMWQKSGGKDILVRAGDTVRELLTKQ